MRAEKWETGNNSMYMVCSLTIEMSWRCILITEQHRVYCTTSFSSLVRHCACQLANISYPQGQISFQSDLLLTYHLFQAHLQELMMNITENYTQCYSNNVSENGSLQTQHEDDEAVTSSASDRITVLNNCNVTNVAVQVTLSLSHNS